MAVVSAFLVPGSPLPYFRPKVKPWTPFVEGFEAAAKALKASKPDALLIFSTQWFAVLDELWQTRPRSKDIHVDENWHELGNLPFDLKSDVKLATACIASCNKAGVKSKGVDYDAFPIDTGTIVANYYLNPGSKVPVVIASNNLYHDWALTEKLGAIAAAEAAKQKKRIAVIGIGGMSGAFFRHKIDFDSDRIAAPKYNKWNKKILALLEKGDAKGLEKAAPAYAKEAKPDMGFKHCAWVLGALGGKFKGAKVHAYGPLYGSGGAVLEFKL